MFKEYPTKNIFEYLRIFLGGVFIVFGLVILFGDIMPPDMEKSFRNVMGFIFVAYGVYRIVHIQYRRNLKKHWLKEDEEI